MREARDRRASPRDVSCAEASRLRAAAWVRMLLRSHMDSPGVRPESGGGSEAPDRQKHEDELLADDNAQRMPVPTGSAVEKSALFDECANKLNPMKRRRHPVIQPILKNKMLVSCRGGAPRTAGRQNHKQERKDGKRALMHTNGPVDGGSVGADIFTARPPPVFPMVHLHGPTNKLGGTLRVARISCGQTCGKKIGSRGWWKLVDKES